MGKYYDGTKLCNKLDLNGEKPELVLCCGNRTSGKTTWFNKKMIDDYLEENKKFALLYRYQYELDDIPNKFFKDVGSLFFDGAQFDAKKRCKNVYQELFFEGASCGYALSLNSADTIKKLSHLFSDVSQEYMDEFQSESGMYCPNELQKFISIHTSLARGQGKQVKFLPVYLCSNTVSLLNPYFAALGISDRLKTNTKFLRGDGYVLEQSFVKAASDAQLSSGFNRAFKDNQYVAYAAQNVYLNDNESFIETVKGHSKYLCTIRYKGTDFGVRSYDNQGIVYCDKKPDLGFPLRIATTTDDHNINYVMLKNNDLLIGTLRYFFEKGCFRFRDLKSKEAILQTVSYF